MKPKILFYLLVNIFIITGCKTPSFLSSTQHNPHHFYDGNATLLIGVTGTDNRKVRHLIIHTQENSYKFYFHKKKISHQLIALTIPTPSSNVSLLEYSLTGMYGCSRGNAGYGKGVYRIPKIFKNKTYFLGTINTSMNTTYLSMPKYLEEEAKQKYHYLHHSKMKKSDMQRFKSHIKLQNSP